MMLAWPQCRLRCADGVCAYIGGMEFTEVNGIVTRLGVAAAIAARDGFWQSALIDLVAKLHRH